MFTKVEYVSPGDDRDHDLFEVTSPCGRVNEHYRFEIEREAETYHGLLGLLEAALKQPSETRDSEPPGEAGQFATAGGDVPGTDDRGAPRISSRVADHCRETET